MVQVNVFYPAGDDIHFDQDYYLQTHMPMVRHLLGDALMNDNVVKGLMGGTPNDPPTYGYVLSMYFESAATFGASMGPNAKQIMADIPNYTNTSPIIQVSEVL